MDADLVWMKSGDKPIKLKLNGANTYYRTNAYKQQLLNVSYTWHMIDIHHRGMYKKDELLDALFAVVGDAEFYPVAYKVGKTVDTFFVRSCKTAMQKLFATCLTITMFDRGQVFLTAALNAAEHTTGQIFPTKVLEKIVNKQFSRLETTDQISKVLNLEQLHHHPETVDIVINMANKAALELLCKVVAQNHHILNSINGLNLSKNNISDPSPLKEFVHSSIKMIDLRHNNISHINQFFQLKCLNIDELYVVGNPCTLQPNYLDSIKKALPTLKKLDGINTERIKETSTDSIEMMYPGDVIQDSRDRVSFTMFRNSDMWCQVVVQHKGQCTKRDIIKAIFEIVEDEFYPCYYKSSRIEDTFFVRNSYKQLENLLDVGMALRVPNCEEIPITLKMNVSDFKKGHIEPTEAIIAAMSTRFNVMDKCLNLSSLHTSPELKNVIVYLSNSLTLATVLKMAARRFLINLEEIRLNNNRISDVKAFRTLNNVKSIKILDLSNNLIDDLNQFENVIKIPIAELKLDGNPLCKQFTSGSSYMRQVKKLFPELVKLDGYPVTKQAAAMPYEKNFLCSLEAYGFVEYFVTNYFPVFDSPLRPQLIEMYDKLAMISVTFNSEGFSMNPYLAGRIEKYKKMNRNHLEVDATQLPPPRFRKDDISEFLNYFPETEHDLFSFTTDVTVFTDDLVCLTIGGVFQEPASITESELRLAFTRTFIFKRYASELGIFKNTNEYKIANEIILITNPTSEQSKTSFRYSKPNQTKTPEPTVEDKENFILMFQRVTGLKTIWCTRCFEEANWDFKKAMEAFLKMEKENRIPDSAFNEI